MEVNAAGSVNVSRLAAKPHVTAGIGGFIDITAQAKHIVFSSFFTAGGLKLAIEAGQLRILQEGRFKKFVPKIEEVTFSGPRARDIGQKVTYITERCVIDLEEDWLTVTEIAPGIRLEEHVLKQADIPLRVSPHLREMDATLFSPEPMRLRLGMKRDPS